MINTSNSYYYPLNRTEESNTIPLSVITVPIYYSVLIFIIISLCKCHHQRSADRIKLLGPLKEQATISKCLKVREQILQENPSQKELMQDPYSAAILILNKFKPDNVAFQESPPPPRLPKISIKKLIPKTEIEIPPFRAHQFSFNQDYQDFLDDIKKISNVFQENPLD